MYTGQNYPDVCGRGQGDLQLFFPMVSGVF